MQASGHAFDLRHLYAPSGTDRYPKPTPYHGTVNTTLLDEARRLSVDERIQLVTAIWDTVAEDADPSCLPVSDSHRLELDGRLKDRQANPQGESPWSDVADRLGKR
jgi:putative addiction module component (TIGR02574 family)